MGIPDKNIMWKGMVLKYNDPWKELIFFVVVSVRVECT